MAFFHGELARRFDVVSCVFMVSLLTCFPLLAGLFYIFFLFFVLFARLFWHPLLKVALLTAAVL